MAGKPYPRPPSSRKRGPATTAEEDAKREWENVPLGFHAHHCVYAQTLRQRGLASLVWDTKNRMLVPWKRHAQHHSGEDLIRVLDLPASTIEFAAENGLGWFIERHYRGGDE